MRKTAGLAVLAAGCLLTACTPGTADGDDALQLVATTTQICDYVTHIAEQQPDSEIVLEKTDSQGKKHAPDGAKPTVKLNCLLAPNASAHDHEMTPQQMKAMSDADLLLTNGVDLEHFLDSAIDSSGFKGSMVVTSGVPNTGAEAGKFTIDAGDNKADVAPWPFDPEPGEEAEFTHDPHIWTSPSGAIVQVRNIGAALAKADADHAADWEKRTDHYVQQLTALDTWAKDSFDSVPQDKRVLFTSHDAFGYLSRDFGIDFIGAALSDFNAQQDATHQHIEEAVEQVKQSHATVIFAENSNNSKSIEAVGRAAGVRIITGEDALYGDSLGPEGSEGETYTGSIIHNVRTLVEAWGGTVKPLPEELRD
ncbi:zinc ABC transporter substrate-binding protein [Corynebacterium hindlerae]|uniref:metal ABC transporter substrate-binding protein n=1 Tax=Corynebacterium hindlerae TaxID=699041 RepID=UPI001AD64B87|nr:metal ABC transporter substrate-binding protein [Corynebacterium hindlerae]QTH60302.1 zinc ABC transporter substrate-binding protein [Corynebacterium hindlerae]